MLPEVHTPVSSRSMVRTVRRVAAGLVTYVGSVTGHRVPQGRVDDRGRHRGGVGGPVVALGDLGLSARRTAGAGAAARTRAGHRDPEALLLADHQAAGDQPGHQQAGRDRGVPPGDDGERGEREHDHVGEQDGAEHAATPAGGAVGGLTTGLAAGRRGLGGRLAGGRASGRADVGLVVTTAADAGRPGVTTRRALRRSTGSRRASTRMVWEKRSTERLRTASSWCLSALGTR